MTILLGDIKFIKSDTMADVPEGGGSITAQVIPDGQSNNIFEDVTTLDRVYGAVHMRKVFASIVTQNRDKYFGARTIIAKLPADTKIGVNLFNTEDWFDRRPAAQTRVENYLAQGPNYNGFLWGTQYKDSKAVTIFQSLTAPQPGIGDVLFIKAATTEQYIRIIKMNATVQVFTDDQGTFSRRVLEITISDSLDHDFIGAQMSRRDDLNPAAKLFKTVVANAARYYSARRLAAPAAKDALSIKVDSVFSQVVPASQAETALLDVNAANATVPVVDAAGGTVNFTTATTLQAGSTLFLGNPCLPGSLNIAISGGNLTDDAGNVYSDTDVVGTIAYAQGLITFSAQSPTYTGVKTVTFRPAAAPAMLAQTQSIRVTAANRGTVWTFSLMPPARPGSLKVSYRALGKWYELRDNATGGIIADDAGIGTGTYNYVTGSGSVTFAVIPDADTDVLLAYGHPADIFNRASVQPGNIKVRHTLAQAGFDPSTLTVTWNDGAARTLTCNASGVLSGYGSGTLNIVTKVLEFTPTSLPLGGTTFTVQYNYGPAITKTISTFNQVGNVCTVDVGDLNIQPGSLKVAFDSPYLANPNHTLVVGSGIVKKEVRDNGSGAWVGGETGSINYANGTFVITASFSATYRRVSQASNVIPLPQVLNKWSPSPAPGFAVASRGFGFTAGSSTSNAGYSVETSTATAPAQFAVTYRLVSAATVATETFNLDNINLDLTPNYAETIIPGSVLFTFSGRNYVDRNGLLFYNINPTTGAGTQGGTIDYASGDVVLSSWVSGQGPATALYALATTMNFDPVEFVVGRTPTAPIKPGQFTLRATKAGGGQVTATADAQGVFKNGDMDGFIEYETGLWRVRFGGLVTATGNESADWYDATQVSGGQIWKPGFVLASTILFNATAYTYLPLDPDILGLNPVRLPPDGRVPCYQPGDTVVVLHDAITTGTYSNSQTTNLGRTLLAKISVKDSANQPVPTNRYDINLDTGVITWLDLSGISQPLKIIDRIEHEAVVTDVQITGEIALSLPCAHAFPATETLVSNEIIFGDLYARTSIPFDQQTWTNVWSDALIGSGVGAQYNFVQYPIVVDNQSAFQERWALIFTSATTFNVVGEHVGQILTNASTGSHCAPLNPNTNAPYFTLDAAGWGGGWSSGNVLRFNTYAANAPVWIIEAIQPGPKTSSDFGFCLEMRGDIDKVA